MFSIARSRETARTRARVSFRHEHHPQFQANSVRLCAIAEGIFNLTISSYNCICVIVIGNKMLETVVERIGSGFVATTKTGVSQTRHTRYLCTTFGFSICITITNTNIHLTNRFHIDSPSSAERLRTSLKRKRKKKEGRSVNSRKTNTLTMCQCYVVVIVVKRSRESHRTQQFITIICARCADGRRH